MSEGTDNSDVAEKSPVPMDEPINQPESMGADTEPAPNTAVSPSSEAVHQPSRHEVEGAPVGDTEKEEQPHLGDVTGTGEGEFVGEPRETEATEGGIGGEKPDVVEEGEAVAEGETKVEEGEVKEDEEGKIKEQVVEGEKEDVPGKEAEEGEKEEIIGKEGEKEEIPGKEGEKEEVAKKEVGEGVEGVEKVSEEVTEVDTTTPLHVEEPSEVGVIKEGEEEEEGEEKPPEEVLEEESKESMVSPEKSLSVPSREEAKDLFDRDAAFAQLRKLTREKAIEKRKNMFLNKKLVEHFRKRKMEFTYREPEGGVPSDAMPRYQETLTEYAEVRDGLDKESRAISEELQFLQDQCNVEESELKESLVALLAREKEIGTGMRYGRTSKPMHEEDVHRLIARQEAKFAESAEAIETYISLRNKMAIKEAQLQSLGMIGENIQLIDYDNLVAENDSLTDKIEEKDNELSHHRLRATTSVQTQAHVREKSDAMEADILDEREKLEIVDEKLMLTRERLNGLKQHRDGLRDETHALKQEAGLLANFKLLLDYQQAQEEVATARKQLASVRTSFDQMKQRIRDYRSQIDRRLHRIAPNKSRLTMKSTDR